MKPSLPWTLLLSAAVDKDFGDLHDVSCDVNEQLWLQKSHQDKEEEITLSVELCKNIEIKIGVP